MSIDQITTPTEGWSAVYLIEGEPFYNRLPIVAWALTDEDDESGLVVAGLVAMGDTIELAHQVPVTEVHFYEYIHEGQVTTERQDGWIKAARELAVDS